MPDHPVVSVYTDFDFRTGTKDSELVPIIWAQIDSVSAEEKVKKHHARATHFELVSAPDEADLWVLPDVWPIYVKKKAKPSAFEFAELAAQNDQNILVWSAGDPERVVPIENSILIQEGLNRGLNRLNAFAFERPGFVIDYFDRFDSQDWQPLKKHKKPRVGFCGQAKSKIRTRIHFYLRNTLIRMKYKRGNSNVVPNLHGFHIDLRAKSLSILEKDIRVKANYILRDRYLAGLRSKSLSEKLQHSSRREFIKNILDNMYTVCVRGGGNFSKRFYEVLCCGRIPILVSTDSKLPFEEIIDWRKHIVQVDYRDLDKLADAVCDFHHERSASELKEIQVSNRKLWVDFLSVRGYYSNFYRYLDLVS